MKKILLASLALLAALTLGAQEPQGRPEKKNFSKEDMEKFRQNAKDRIQSEHIAYLTAELELTPAEAEKFWPVYNKAHREQMENNQTFRSALKALKMAVKEGKSEAEIKDALDAYNKAKSGQRNVLADYQKDFIKIIGVTKTAKLYVAEDSFRTRQIHNLTGGGKGQAGYGKGQPGGPGRGGFNGGGKGGYNGPGKGQPKERPGGRPQPQES